MKDSIIRGLLLSAFFASTQQAYAAGFALIEQSASGMGNAFAGGSAVAEDASTVYFNPAGMTYLPDSQLTIAGHAIRPSAEFTNNGSHRAASTSLLTSGGNGGDIGDWAILPNIFYSKHISSNLSLGVGISAPYGLKTEYDNNWVGRYQAIKSDLKTININPSLGYKFNDVVSFGFGISAMRVDAELTNAVDTGTLIGLPQQRDSTVSVKGDDWGYGWNMGALFQITDSTRLGLSYRSQVHFKLEGDANFSNVPTALASQATLGSGTISAKVTTPDTLSASFAHQLNNEWSLLGDVTWTNWSKFKDLTIVRTSGTLSGQNLNSVPENWKDTVRVSVGTTYQYNEAVKLRTGIAYDESPVPSQYRTPRIPDNDRYWLSIGAAYKVSDTSNFDFGYAHIFIKDGAIAKTTDTSLSPLRDVVSGSYDSQVDILSLQYTHNF